MPELRFQCRLHRQTVFAWGPAEEPCPGVGWPGAVCQASRGGDCVSVIWGELCLPAHEEQSGPWTTILISDVISMLYVC